MAITRIGTGFDAHRLVPGRPLIVGGVHVPHDLGLQGHSDADVLLHALGDALLGAAALGDLGRHFPPGDPKTAGADSSEFVRQISRMLLREGWRPLNIDSTIIAEEPKMAPHIPGMRQNIAALLDLELDAVSVKATTTEGMGWTGRGEGIAAQCAVLITGV